MIKTILLIISIISASVATKSRFRYFIDDKLACATRGPYAYINTKNANGNTNSLNDSTRWLIGSIGKCRKMCDQFETCAGFNYVSSGMHSNGFNQGNGTGTCYFRDIDALPFTNQTAENRICYRKSKALKPVFTNQVKCENNIHQNSVPYTMRGNVEIKCANDEFIRISKHKTYYGRTKDYNKQCFYSGSSPNLACKASNTYDIVKNKCDGKTECKINPSNSVFGDPCLGTYKYLSVSHRCIKINTATK
jgi:hypothetical protein